MELRNETDSVAYVIGLNVGYNLQRMDSTLNVEAVCQAVRDVYARTARMTPRRGPCGLSALRECFAARTDSGL